MKRRPTGEDRDLADVLRKLEPGQYRIDVSMIGDGIAFTGLARLKPEGGCNIDLWDRYVTISPVRT